MNNNFRQITIFPYTMAVKTMLVFIVALAIVSLWFSPQVLPWYMWLFCLVPVFMFSFGSNTFTKRWGNVSRKRFIRSLVFSSLFIRLIFVIFIYYYNYEHFGTYWGAGSTDVTFYVPEAFETAEDLSHGYFNVIKDWINQGIDLGDTGYMTYLVLVYILTFRVSDVMIPLLLKALWSALTCWMIYRVTQRHFGESVARMAGVFAMLYPSFIWWCGSMMKETEMLTITMVFVDQVDAALMEEKITFRKLIFALFWGTILFTFRTVLGVVAYLATLLAIILTSQRIVSWAKKVLFVILVVGFVSVALGDNLRTTMESLMEGAQSTATLDRNEARSKTSSIARYATVTVMAPLIFTVPFPTLVYTSFEQEQNMQRSGANYVKNILSFIVILVMFILLLSGDWRYHVFIISFMIGYLIVLVFSSFSHSGRFHLPAELFEVIFAAYGVSLLNNPKYKRWMNYAFIGEFIIIIAWNYFKLAGRGLV